jgi:hypothetical protein
MKIIKSFLPITICLCSAITLQAQESKTAAPPQVKTAIEKPVEVTYPAKDKPTAVPAPAATSAGKAEPKQEAPEKLEARTFNKNDISNPGGEQGARIMAGKATPPVEPVYSPSTVDPKPAPSVVKPAANKQQLQ